jgi:hypothetical protein
MIENIAINLNKPGFKINLLGVLAKIDQVRQEAELKDLLTSKSIKVV